MTSIQNSNSNIIHSNLKSKQTKNTTKTVPSDINLIFQCANIEIADIYILPHIESGIISAQHVNRDMPPDE